MLREQEVSVKWRQLFSGGEVTTATIQDAQRVLGQLPLESPLRLRLDRELTEIARLKLGTDDLARIGSGAA